MGRRGKFSYTTRRKIVIGLAVAILALLWLFRNISFIILAASSIALILLFHLVDSMFDLRFKPRHYLFMIIVAVTGFLLFPLYTLYPAYDKILHFAQPFLLSSIVFHMVNHLKLGKKWKITFTFFIVVGGIGLFEVAEYGLDYFFDLNLQGVFLRNLQEFGDILQWQEPLDDTMLDMMFGMAGSVLYLLYISIFCRKKRY